MENNFSNLLKSALIHFLYNFFVYYLFVLPFDLWKKAISRLADQREKGALRMSEIKTQWPFLSFLKVFLIEFMFDGVILISYILGPILAIVLWISSESFTTFIGCIVMSYYAPIFLSLLRDVFILSLLPIRKFLSWVSKPAQYLDLEIKNK